MLKMNIPLFLRSILFISISLSTSISHGALTGEPEETPPPTPLPTGSVFRTITGTVTDSLTDQPIQSATVTGHGGIHQTDENGNYSFTVLIGEFQSIQISAEKEGYEPFSGVFTWPETFEPIDIELTPIDGSILNIFVIPEEARWALDGPDVMFNDHGTTRIEQLPLGEYSLFWEPLTNWDQPEPNPYLFTMAREETTYWGWGIYTRHTGGVEVEVAPDDATWELTDGDDAITTGSGDSTLRGIPTGEIALTWEAIERFDPPQPNPATRTLDKDTTETFTGAYTRQTGTIMIDPTANARWSDLDGDGAEHEGVGDATLSNIPTGDIVLTWHALEQYDLLSQTPATRMLDKNESVTFAGEYARHLGTVAIETTPDEAAWSFTDGDGVELGGAGDQLFEDIPTGSIALTWSALASHDAPGPNPAVQTLDKGSSVTFTGIYGRHTGTVEVNVSPNSAPWSLVDGDGETHEGIGNQRNTSIPTGSIGFTWHALEGYETPPAGPQTRTLEKDKTIRFTGIYLTQASNLARRFGEVIQYLLGQKTEVEGLDANADGTIDIADAIVSLDDSPPAAPDAPQPADAETDTELTLQFAWLGHQRTTVYDLYLWQAQVAKPATPTAGGLTATTFIPDFALEPRTSYDWQVMAWNGETVTPGTVWSFTTGDTPNILLIPTSGDQPWQVGSSVMVQWKMNKDVTGTALRFELWRAGELIAELGTGWSETGEGSATYVVPPVEASADYRLRAVSIWMESQGDPNAWVERLDPSRNY